MQHRITIRLDDEDYRGIVQDADIAGLSAAAYVRRRCRGRRIAAKSDLRVLAELRRIGGLLKHIHSETRGAYSAKTARAIDEIAAFVRLMNDALASRGRSKEQ